MSTRRAIIGAPPQCLRTEAARGYWTGACARYPALANPFEPGPWPMGFREEKEGKREVGQKRGRAVESRIRCRESDWGWAWEVQASAGHFEEGLLGAESGQPFGENRMRQRSFCGTSYGIRLWTMDVVDRHGLFTFMPSQKTQEEKASLSRV